MIFLLLMYFSMVDIFFDVGFFHCRRRSSVMHVPSELSYIPMVYAATFVVPKIYRSSSSLLNATEEEGRWSLCCGLLALTNAAAFVLCTCDPCTGGPDLTSSLSQPLKISTFCVLAVIYSLPVFPAAPSSTTPKNLPVVLGLAKAAVLFAGILLFSRKTDCGEPDDSNQIYYYDFYSLRVLSQSDHHHYWGNFRAIFLRLSPLLSSCWWFTHHWKVPSASIDAHELRTAFTFASIILGVLSVASRAHLSPDEHSSGILVSQVTNTRFLLIDNLNITLLIDVFLLTGSHQGPDRRGIGPSSEQSSHHMKESR